jgi:hypothetical protein
MAASVVAPVTFGGCSTRSTDAGSESALGVKGLVISQAYAGGGLENAKYKNDFVELFNPTAGPLVLEGLSLQYTSTAEPVSVALPKISLEQGKYTTISLAGAKGGVGGTTPADVRLPDSIDLGEKAGKLALMQGDAVMDVLVYGESATHQSESTAVPALGADTSALRAEGGCGFSFEAKTPVPPRTASSDANPCPIDMAESDAGSDADAAPPDTGPRDTGTDAPAPAGPRLLISQVYGGGSGPSAAFKRDYVELFNPTKQSQVLSGLWLQYANGKGSFKPVSGDGGSDYASLPFPKDNEGKEVTIPAGGYFLIATAAGSPDAGAAADLPPVDMSAPIGTQIDLNAKDGKIALVQGGTPLACGGAGEEHCKSARIVDMVGYGDVSDYEGTGAVVALDPTKAAVRNGNGCDDTGNNAADFSVARVGVGATMPRNSLSERNICNRTPPPTGPGEDPLPPAKKADAGKPSVVPTEPTEGGCSLAPRSGSTEGSFAGLGALVALGVILASRRRDRQRA